MHHISRDGFEESVVSSAVKEGFIEGESVGLKKGRAEEKAKGDAKVAKSAVKMFEDGIPFDMIGKYTGLSISQIETLIREGISPFVKEKPAKAKARAKTATTKKSTTTSKRSSRK
jgi:hypothetical protein